METTTMTTKTKTMTSKTMTTKTTILKIPTTTKTMTDLHSCNVFLAGRGWGEAAGDAAEEDLPGDLHSASPLDNSSHLAQTVAGWSVLQWDEPEPESGGRLPPWLGFPLHLLLLLLLSPLPLKLVHSLLFLLKPGSPSPLTFLPSLPPCPLHSPALARIPPKLLLLLLLLILLPQPLLLLRLHNEALQGAHPHPRLPGGQPTRLTPVPCLTNLNYVLSFKLNL